MFKLRTAYGAKHLYFAIPLQEDDKLCENLSFQETWLTAFVEVALIAA